MTTLPTTIVIFLLFLILLVQVTKSLFHDIRQYCKPTSNIDIIQCTKRISYCRKFGIHLVWVGPAHSCNSAITSNHDLNIGLGGCQCGTTREDYCGFICEEECNKRSFCKWSGSFCKFADGTNWLPPAGNFTCNKHSSRF
jgi:hypothetical protein